MKIKAIIFTAISILFSGCCVYIDSTNRETEFRKAFFVEWNDSVGEAIMDRSYAEGDYHLFNIFLPADRNPVTNPKSRHLIMFTHGGGWTQGNRNDGNLYCKYFTSKGYVTATIDYTLSDGSHDPTISSINEELKQAVSAIKNVSAANGCPLDDMATFGFSAGGCQSLLYAFKEKTSLLPVKFVLDWSGPTSFNPDDWTAQAGTYPPLCEMVGLDGTNEGKARLVKKFSGHPCTAEDVANGTANQWWNEISPLHYVDSSPLIPPVLVCYGVYDRIVPTRHQRLLIEKLQNLKNQNAAYRYDVIEFKNSGHALCCDDDKVNEFKTLADWYCENYF